MRHEMKRRHDEEDEEPVDPRPSGLPALQQDDDHEHRDGEEDPLDHLGDGEDPVVTLGVDDLLVVSQLLLQILDAHGTSLAVVSAATYHAGRAA